jgi:hypothetical protein
MFKFNKALTSKLRAMPTKFSTAASKAISVRTLNQRKPQVAMATPKVAQMFKPGAMPSVTAYTKPTVFAEKPFKIAKPMLSFYKPKPNPYILTKYSKPMEDYQSRYLGEQTRARNLQMRLSKITATLAIERRENQQQKVLWEGEKRQFKSSPFYPAHQVSRGMMKRYDKATRVITPSVNGIGSIGAASETASKVGAGLLGVLFLGLIIGRVE